MHYVYILQSLKDKKLYTGMTEDLKMRLDYHNAGKVRSTKFRIPFRLIYHEEYKTQREAREREVYLKSYAGSREKMRIVEKVLGL